MAFRAGFESGGDRCRIRLSACATAGTSGASRTERRRRRRPTRASTTGWASLLPAVARPRRHDVHLRLLVGGHDDARGGAAQQDGARLPQGAAQAGRDVRRRRLRLRRASVPRARALRRASGPASTRRPSRSRCCAPRSRAAVSPTGSSVVEGDFREMRGQYDKVLSIGMLEHAGRDQLDEVVRAHADSLKPGGLGVMHFIGHVGVCDTEFFIRKHVFPGGWIPSLAEAIEAMERAGLEVVDIENLRRHYALTLDCWAERFDRNWDAIHALDPRASTSASAACGAPTCGCAEMFRSPQRPHASVPGHRVEGQHRRESYPMSRAFLYPPHAVTRARRHGVARPRAPRSPRRPRTRAPRASPRDVEPVPRARARAAAAHRPRAFRRGVRVDAAAGVVEAEGMTTYATLVDAHARARRHAAPSCRS